MSTAGSVQERLHINFQRRWLFAGSVSAFIGLLVGNTVQAGGISVDITPYVNANMQTALLNGSNYPAGGTILNNAGVSFVLATFPGGGTGAIETSRSPTPNAFDISVNISNPDTVYTLINSEYGVFGFAVGYVEFRGTGGLDYQVNLIEGQNIRDHANNIYNNKIGSPPLGSMYVNTFSFGGGIVRLDEQAFVLPTAFQTATLTDIILHGTGNVPNGEPFLAAATVTTVPEPTSLVTLGLGTGIIGIISALGWRRRQMRVT